MQGTIEDFYGDAGPTGRPFSGQIDPTFQDWLQAEHSGVKESDCHFYHTLDLGNGRVVPGGWDLRGRERSYLGHVEFRGLNVLEFGPASGYLSFWMEGQGAKVTTIDLPPGSAPDLVPLPGVDLDANAKSGAETARQVRNSWWYAHRQRGSKARAVYADIYRLPSDLGRYDVSTFGSILLHLGSPFCALREAARITDTALIVTDVLPPIIYGTEGNSFVEFNPGDEPANLVNWWAHSPSAIRKMLRLLSFPHSDTHYFRTTFHPEHNPDHPPVTRFMFTVVGQHEPNKLRRLDKLPEEATEDSELRQLVPVINAANYNQAHRLLQETDERLRHTTSALVQTEGQLKEALTQLEKIYRSVAYRLTKPIRLLMHDRT